MASWLPRARRLAKTMQPPRPVSGAGFGTVKTVSPLVVTVFGGTDQAMACVTSYTPVVGDTVLYQTVKNYPIAVGAIGSLPSF